MTFQFKNNRTAWLDGPSAQCSELPAAAPQPPWRLVLLGAPGVGKGTQAELLHQRLGTCHLSTGDVFRAASCRSALEQSPAMTAALEHMRRGELVPDSTVWEIVKERCGCLRCHGGFVLDGFPRTIAQAESLKELMEKEKISLNAVVDYELPVAEIVSRISGRRTCKDCKAVFHLAQKPPQKDGLCDHCGGPLFHREDDRQEAVIVRLQTYERSTAPLIDFYKELGLLVCVPAVGTPDEIYERTIGSLNAGFIH